MDLKIINRLLRKNLSAAQLTGFAISNFIGLAIVIAGVQFWQDVKSLWEDEDSFIRKDYMVVNKRITSAATIDGSSPVFTEEEIADLERQPWVRKVGRFTPVDYHVNATVERGQSSLSTYMFFESVPRSFIDVDKGMWTFNPGDAEIPIILSKDYLTLYNFGFASSAAMPKLSESVISSIPLTIEIKSDDGTRRGTFRGRIAGFSNRLNTILVPEEFMQWSRNEFGTGEDVKTSRLIVDVSSPGDVRIGEYMEAHDLELAGDKTASSASYLLNVLTGIVLGVGVVITALSFFILLLSISLLMQKNRDKLHALIMLGFDLKTVGAPYRKLIIAVCSGTLVLALAVCFAFRASYMPSIAPLTGNEASLGYTSVGDALLAPAVGIGLTVLIILFNIRSINKRVASSRYL